MDRVWALQMEFFNDKMMLDLVSDPIQPKCWEDVPWESRRHPKQDSDTSSNLSGEEWDKLMAAESARLMAELEEKRKQEFERFYPRRVNTGQ